MRFVRNLILSERYELYYDDVSVTSFINIKCGNVATEITPSRTVCCYVGFVGRKT